MKAKKKKLKTGNVVAKDLRTPKYRVRVIENKKKFHKSLVELEKKL